MLDHDRLAAVVRRLDPAARLIRAWALTGGVSADVTALELAYPDGRVARVVVRQHGAADRAYNPHIAADEFQLLTALHSAGLPVPEPLRLDESGAIFPTPYLVQAFVDGATDFAPSDLPAYLDQSAEALAALHRLDPGTLDDLSLPDFDAATTANIRTHPVRLDESLGEGHIRAALAAIWPPPARNEKCLLHGDFWPGNVIWQDGQLAAILDWEDAALGDPLADLGNARLELLWAFGEDALRDFTRRYQARMPHLDYSALPAWDLVVALRPAYKLAEWVADPAQLRRMRDAHARFVAQAVAALPRP